MNKSALVFLASEEVFAVKCVFSDRSNGKYTPKEYTYKITDKSIKVDDLVVVQCKGESNHYGFCVVRVVEVNSDIDLTNEDHGYVWVVGKLDLSTMEAFIKAEKELISEVKKLELRTKKAQLKQALGIDGLDKLRLSNFMNDGFTKQP